MVLEHLTSCNGLHNGKTVSLEYMSCWSCSQDTALRENYWTPEKVVNLFTFVATEVREILASLGFKSINDIIGRTDLLSQVNKGASNLDDLDLNFY